MYAISSGHTKRVTPLKPNNKDSKIKIEEVKLP